MRPQSVALAPDIHIRICICICNTICIYIYICIFPCTAILCNMGHRPSHPIFIMSFDLRRFRSDQDTHCCATSYATSGLKLLAEYHHIVHMETQPGWDGEL